MLPSVDLTKMSCGLFHTHTSEAFAVDPLIATAIQPFPAEGILDVKVHMLMPGQFPCVPNWHFDFVPRDSAGRAQPQRRDPKHVMWMLLSGAPFTEFRDGRVIVPWEWIPFTQYDEHRGVASADFCWRLFARIVPEELCRRAEGDDRIRRHSQVYLDAQNFMW